MPGLPAFDYIHDIIMVAPQVLKLIFDSTVVTGKQRIANGQALNLVPGTGQGDALSAYGQAAATSGPLGSLIARLGERTATIIDVGNRYELHARQRRCCVHVSLAHDAETDATNLHVIVRRYRLGRFLSGHASGSGQAKSRRSDAGTLQEMATSDGHDWMFSRMTRSLPSAAILVEFTIELEKTSGTKRERR